MNWIKNNKRFVITVVAFLLLPVLVATVGMMQAPSNNLSNPYQLMSIGGAGTPIVTGQLCSPQNNNWVFYTDSTTKSEWQCSSLIGSVFQWNQLSTGTGGPPTGAAGGVLNGTYPNPGLATLTTATTWSASGGTGTITPTTNRVTFATTGLDILLISSAASAYIDSQPGFNTFIATQNSGQIVQIGTAAGSNTIVGTLHYGGTVPTASVGTIETHSTNQAGSISALSAATTTTITFANSGWTNVAYCTASPSVSLAAAPYVSAISKTAVTFTFPSLTGSLYYNCAGS